MNRRIHQNKSGSGPYLLGAAPTYVGLNGPYFFSLCLTSANPPFSLFREYVGQLIEFGKKFVIIGSMNAVTYKEIFPLLKDNVMWLGNHYGDMAFKVPANYEERSTRYWVDDTGQKWRSLGNICWYTNLDIPKRHAQLTLYKQYNPKEYLQYANYDAINVDLVADIPYDFSGNMGVPITFLNSYNPDQFEILGQSTELGRPMSEIAPDGTYVKGGIRFYLPNKDGTFRRLYDRIVIRRKVPPE